MRVCVAALQNPHAVQAALVPVPDKEYELIGHGEQLPAPAPE